MRILIVLPAYNEQLILEKNLEKMCDFCGQNLADEWLIVVADNNSTDRTGEIARSFAQRFGQVEYLFIGQQGKGIAIKTAWQKYPADIYCFMDADLATDLEALPELIAAIKAGNDIAIGSRFHPQSKVVRSWSRILISRAYQLVLKVALHLKISDLPCGFKAINSQTRNNLLAQVQNQAWFFDSELVILGEKQGYKISEIPIFWQDFREGEDKSRVKAVSLGWEYFKQVLALKKRLKKIKN